MSLLLLLAAGSGEGGAVFIEYPDTVFHIPTDENFYHVEEDENFYHVPADDNFYHIKDDE